MVTVAGMRATGSDAAGQLVSNPAYFEEALRSAPADWKSKNIQFAVKAEVVDFVAGPPEVSPAISGSFSTNNEFVAMYPTEPEQSLYRLLDFGDKPQRRNIFSCVFRLASLWSIVRRCRGESGSS